MKIQPMEWVKIFAKIYLKGVNIWNIYVEITQHKAKKDHIIPFCNGQKTWIDIFPKKTCKRPIGTSKGVQHHYSSGKCKSKLLKLWDIT